MVTKALVFLACVAGVHAAVRKGIKGNGIRARDRARGGREEGNFPFSLALVIQCTRNHVNAHGSDATIFDRIEHTRVSDIHILY